MPETKRKRLKLIRFRQFAKAKSKCMAPETKRKRLKLIRFKQSAKAKSKGNNLKKQRKRQRLAHDVDRLGNLDQEGTTRCYDSEPASEMEMGHSEEDQSNESLLENEEKSSKRRQTKENSNNNETDSQCHLANLESQLKRIQDQLQEQGADSQCQLAKLESQLKQIQDQQAAIKQDVEKNLHLCGGSGGNSLGTASAVPSKHMIDGRNVMKMPTRDGYSFGLQLLDMFFTPEELSQSLVYESKKSTKPGLDKTKVDRLMELVFERSPNVDQKKLVSKLNQKCRDTLAKLRKHQMHNQVELPHDERPYTPLPGEQTSLDDHIIVIN